MDIKKLAGGKNGKPFAVDLGSPSKRFYLGTDEREALARRNRLGGFWERWCQLAGEREKNTAGTGKKEWDEFSLEVATAIRQGKKTFSVDVVGMTDGDEFDYRIRMDDLNKYFGEFISFIPTDKNKYDALPNLLRDYDEAKKVLREHKAKGGLDKPVIDTLTAFKSFILETMICMETKKPTEWALIVGNICDFLSRQIPNGLLLRNWDYSTINKFCISLANRPDTLRGKPIAPAFALTALKITRRWIKWTSKNFAWKKPEDWMEATAHKPKLTGKEKSDKATHVQRITYTDLELKTLFRYASKNERAVMLLAINCGFGAMEISTFRKSELHGDTIKRIRIKKSVYGEWKLWAETMKAIDLVSLPNSDFVISRNNGKELISPTPSGRSNKLASMWQRLNARILKDEPTFRQLSFNKLRKTAGRAIRRISNAETASIFLAHGENTPDDQLEAYAAPDFAGVFSAVEKYHAELITIIGQATAERTTLPLDKIDLVKALWRSGKDAKEVGKLAEVSRATVYRYRVGVAV